LQDEDGSRRFAADLLLRYRQSVTAFQRLLRMGRMLLQSVIYQQFKPLLGQGQ
jgi:hypothetical protein